MYCTKCGLSMPQNARFCSECGQSVQYDARLQGLFERTILLQENCYLSTPQHLSSFIGKFIYIYISKGVISVTSDSLVYTSEKGNFTIQFDSITNIKIGHYPRLAKPIRLDYISVTYFYNGCQSVVLLTPTRSAFTPVWQTNKIISNFMVSLNEIINRYRLNK